jgi:hypothetical protein
MQRTVVKLGLLSSILVIVTLVAGCGGKEVAGPPTVPIKGKVEFTKGGNVAELSNRTIAIAFQSIEQPDLLAFGPILEDGTFTMTTQVDENGKPGVVAGTHRVKLLADESAERFVNRKFLNYETSGLTVKVPPEGDVVIRVFK